MDGSDDEAVTQDWLLDNRVSYLQPRHGFRSGIEPVLLAASIPARPGEHVLESGSGAGAALLCLAARVPDLYGLGVERDAGLVALAIKNAAANRAAGLRFLAADIAETFDAGWFDHALANPPYHSPSGTVSPYPARTRAKQAANGLFAQWAHALAAPLRHRGTLTFILPAAALPRAMAAMRDAGCAPTAILPLWPKPDRPAKLLLLRGIKGGRAPMRLLPGLILHDLNGAFTQEAEAILRGGKALPLD